MKRSLSHCLSTAAFALAFTLTFSCSSDGSVIGRSSSSDGGNGGNPDPSSSSVNDGGETYETVVIGSQTWMARNLNVPYNDGIDSWCYGNDPANCAKYGRLYNWAAAMVPGLCPAGFHVPTNADWDKLMRFVDSDNPGSSGSGTPYDSETAGKYLKATSGWNSGGNGTDKYGFSALPGGYYRYNNGNFGNAGSYGDWWSTSEYDSYFAYSRNMSYNDEYARWVNSRKSYGFSVRCLQD